MFFAFLFCLSSFLVQVPSNSAQFYVERVEVVTSDSAALVLKLANTVVPPDKLVTKRDIGCLVDQLKATGLFRGVKHNLVPSREGVYKLILACHHEPDAPTFLITEVTLDRLPEVDKAKFFTRLTEKGVKIGMPLFSHSYKALNERINESLREALPPNLVDQYQGSAWITIRPAGARRVKLIVSPEYRDCFE